MLDVDPEDFLKVQEEEMIAARNRESGQENTEAKIARMMGIDPAEAAQRKAQKTKEEAARAPLTEGELEACRALGVEPLEYYQAKCEEAGLKPS